MRPSVAAAILALAPALAAAQGAFPTAFPEGAKELAPDALAQRLAGNVYVVKPANGPPYRLQYQKDVVYFNMGNVSDEGAWRVEGSAACVEFKRIPSGCSQMRLVGDVLYTKRNSNGEVVVMQKQ